MRTPVSFGGTYKVSYIFRKSRLLVTVLAVALLATGCFGLFSPKSPPSPEPTRLEVTLFGPVGLLEQLGSGTAAVDKPQLRGLHKLATWTGPWSAQRAMAALRHLPGEQPLGGVPVALFELGNLQAGSGGPLLTGHTMADGKFTFTGVPTGVDLVVVTMTEPRMTTIIPSPGSRSAATINSATTLAGEALARDFAERGGTVDAVAWDRVVSDVELILGDLDLTQEALLDALADLIPERFGDGLPETPSDVWSPLAEAILDAVVLGYDGTYSIQGVVFNQGERGVAGVEIAFSGDYESVFTDEDGYFHKDGLVGEVTVTVVETDDIKPLESDWSPASITVTENKWLNFFVEVLELVDPPYSVSGTIKRPDGTPVEGVEIHVHRHDEHVVTDGSGAFTVSNIGLKTTVKPVMDGYAFEPPSYFVVGERTDLQFEAFLTEEVTIEFADPNLEAAAREALKYMMDDPDGPITVEHASRLNMLTTWDWPISDLSGLEYFTGLDTLYIGHADNIALDDLSPLENLDNLRLFLVYNSSVSDLSPLKNKRKLESLRVDDSQVEDISVVTTLPMLNVLSLNGNPVTDLSPLENWQRSSEAYGLSLELKNTHITNVNALTSLTNLDTLYLSGNEHLTDISGLLATSVTWVDLHNTPALDWCDYESTWFVVDTILRRAESARVFTNTPCTGPYKLSGTIERDSDSHFTWDIDFYVVFKSGNDSSYAEAELSSGLYVWEGTAQGNVTIEPRIRPERSLGAVWRFDPSRKSASRPERNIAFFAYRDETAPIVEGHAVDGLGNPIPGVEIRIVDSDRGLELAKLTTDEYGFFRHEFDERLNVTVYAEKDGWLFAPPENWIAPVHLRLEGSRAEGTIAFLRNGELRTVLPDGTGDTVVASVGNLAWRDYGANSLLSWSPDAERLAFVAESSTHPAELRVIHRNGTGETMIYRAADEDLRSPSWGADNRIVYSRRALGGSAQPAQHPWRLWSITTGGSGNKALVENAHMHFLDARWSPDFTQLLVTVAATQPIANAPRYIYTLSADGTNMSEPLVEGVFPSWAPTGDAFVYLSDDGIYVYDFASGTSTFITDGTQPTWSPDGEYVAFQRAGDIYIHELASGQEQFVTEGTHPVWSPH